MHVMLSKIQALFLNNDVIHHKTAKSISHIDGVPVDLAFEVDANGSPVTMEAGQWLVCFVPGLRRQWWHPFANARHKHVFALRMVDESTWILVEPWWTRLMVNVVSLDEAVKFLRWGAVGNILEVREAIPGSGSQARGWSNCAVLISFLLGRSYRTWTPHGLYCRLLAEAGTTSIDLSSYLAKHLRYVANKIADDTLIARPEENSTSLEDQLLSLGTRILSATISSSAIGLYKVAISESSRFKSAAEAYWTFGPKRAIERVRVMLEKANSIGDLKIGDSALAARQFVAMLRGDRQLEIVFKADSSPDPIEIRTHVKSVVEVFLRGTCLPIESTPIRIQASQRLKTAPEASVSFASSTYRATSGRAGVDDLNGCPVN